MADKITMRPVVAQIAGSIRQFGFTNPVCGNEIYRRSLAVGIAGLAGRSAARSSTCLPALAVPAKARYSGVRAPAAAACGDAQCLSDPQSGIRLRPRKGSRARDGHNAPGLVRLGGKRGGISGALLIRATAVDVAAIPGLCSRTAMRFFRPANASGFGATVGLAMLAGFDAERLAAAVGIYYGQCSGTM
jgi:hypothetical protein